MKRNKKPEAQLEAYQSEAHGTINRWRHIAVNGCSDPFWPDGVNMNLLRNHLIYYKRLIREVCAENDFDLPAEAFYPDLPYVDENYFVKPNSERAKRIKNFPNWKTRNLEPVEPAIYDELSLVLF